VRPGMYGAPPRVVGSMTTFFGFHMPNFTFAGVPADGLFDRVVQNAQAAERAGFDLVTLMDHVYQIGGIGPETDPMLEAYTALGALAPATSRIRLGTLVTGVTYRNPALLAKMVTTLDIVSKGRAVMGIGAAWNESEHAGYGFEFPAVRERMDRLDEALTIIKRMFRDERPSFRGRYYRIERAVNSPRPVQPGGPKVLIGGGGEKRTLRLLARHGDIGHWFGGNLADLRRKKRIFEQHCEAEGRDPSTVMLTVGIGLVLVEHEREAPAVLERIPAARRATIAAATIPQAADLLGQYLAAGFGGFTLSNQTLPTTEAIERAGDLINTVRRAAA
jgi:F420-dependent oxidoreductase-like protein